jgi:tetratricopeptide (TPR) repeat protein
MYENYDGSDFYHAASEKRGVSMDRVLFAVAITLFVGFSIGTGVTILGTSGGGQVSNSRDIRGQRGGLPDEKIRIAESILEKNPNNVLVLIDLGNTCFDAGLYQEAIEAYSRALSIEPRNADVRNDLGIMHREMGQYDKAVEAFRQASLDDPLHARSRFNLGIVLAFDMKDDHGAIEAWEEFLALEPCVNRNDRRIKMVKSEIERMKRSK